MVGIKVYDYSKYVFIMVFVFILFLTFLTLRPFLYIIILAGVLTYLFFPVYTRLLKFMKRSWLAGGITVLCMMLVILVPILLLYNALSTQAAGVIGFVQQGFSDPNTTRSVCQRSEGVCGIVTFIEQNPGIKVAVETFIQNSLNYFVNLSLNLVTSIANFVIQIVVLFVLSFTFLTNGAVIVKRFWLMIPLATQHRARITEAVNGMIRGLMYGTIVTAIVQGVIGAIGYAIFSVPSPLFWGFLTMLASFVPFIGTTLIWVPLSLFLLFSPLSPSPWMGIGLILYGTFGISLVDNIIKPKVIGKHTSTHPVLIFLGIVGGLASFGLIGAIIGPMILSLFVMFIKFYEDEKHDV
ncbi:MAG: AI-2E family transporter [Nanoarchaeota archaeon]